MKPEKIYKVVDVNDELPTQMFNTISSGDSWKVGYFNKEDKFFYADTNFRHHEFPESWLKEEPQPQYCFSADELKKLLHKLFSLSPTEFAEYISSLNIK